MQARTGEVFKTLSSYPLPDGSRKEGPYNRRVYYQPGYDDLLRIVAGLQKDVKKINKCITLQGAQEYVNAVDKDGVKLRKNWSAHEADITGPNGVPDGVKEVFVCDANGNLKVINGYGLKTSDYPIRKAYYTQNNTIEARKEKPYSKFKEETREIAEDYDEKGNFVYKNDYSSIGPEFAILNEKRSIVTPKEVFKQFCFKPVFDGFKEEIVNDTKLGLTPLDVARLYTKIFNITYYKIIVLNSLLLIGYSDVYKHSKKDIDKLISKKSVKEQLNGTALELLKKILNNENYRAGIEEYITYAINSIVFEHKDDIDNYDVAHIYSEYQELPPLGEGDEEFLKAE